VRPYQGRRCRRRDDEWNPPWPYAWHRTCRRKRTTINGNAPSLTHSNAARWWEQALYWEREKVWPQRLHQVAGGDAGGDLEWWRIVGRDAVVFPEVVAVADALLDPGMGELVWVDSSAGRPQVLSVDGLFCRRLGERVGRGWLGPLAAADHGGPLIAWMGSVIRLRRWAGGPPSTTTTPGGCAGSMSR